MTQVSIANMLDNAIAAQSATEFRAGSNATMRGLLTGAVLFKLKGTSPATTGIMYDAFVKAGFTDGTAKNYGSKCKVASTAKHFQWAVDVNAPLGDVVDGIFPEFIKYWGAGERDGNINDVKSSGPATIDAADAAKVKAAAERAVDKAKSDAAAKEAAEKAGPALSLATPLQIMAAFLASLSQVGGDGIRVLSTSDLMGARDAIQQELVARANETRAIEELPEQIAA